jgi:hypothetical protein
MTTDETPEEAGLSGMVITDLPPAELTSALERAGLRASLAQSTHKGARVFIDALVGDADCEIQPYRPGEYLVANAGGERGALLEMSRGLSAALTGMGIRHALELYGADREMYAYFHHEWPLS